MNEVLDNFEEKKKKDYSKRSFRQFIIAVSSLSIAAGLFWYLRINKLEIREQGVSSVFSLCFYLFLIFTILGFINGIRSYRLKEPTSKMKQVAIIGNALLFCLLIGYFMYSYEYLARLFTTEPVEVESL